MTIFNFKAEAVKDQAADMYANAAESVADLRRGVTRQFEAGKKYIDQQRQALLPGSTRVGQPFRRLIHSPWG